MNIPLTLSGSSDLDEKTRLRALALEDLIAGVLQIELEGARVLPRHVEP